MSRACWVVRSGAGGAAGADRDVEGSSVGAVIDSWVASTPATNSSASRYTTLTGPSRLAVWQLAASGRQFTSSRLP